MKSRQYRAISLRRTDGTQPLAVVCIESIERSALNGVSKDVAQRSINHLVNIIEGLEKQAILLDNALSEGL